jgi:hypothetical protein
MYVANTSPSQGQLLAEVEDLLRTMPARETLGYATDESVGWLGRATAIVEQWDGIKGVLFRLAVTRLDGVVTFESNKAFREMLVFLHQARNDLRMRTLGPTNVALPQGGVFDYFDEIRKTVELAN